MLSKKKICIISSNPFSIGGLQRVTIDMANILCKEYDVDILCIDESANKDKSPYELDNSIVIKKDRKITKEINSNIFIRGIRYINRRMLGIKNLAFLEAIYLKYSRFLPLIDFINNNEYDAVIGLQFRFSVILGYIKEEVNAKCIGWLHSTYEAYYETKASYYWKQHELAKEYLQKLDDCILLSYRDVCVYKDKLNLSTRYIYNPIIMGDDQYKKRQFIEGNKKVLWVGRLSWEPKGLNHLLEIAHELQNKCPEVMIEVIGDGLDKRRFEKEIKNNNIKNITIHDSTNDMKRVYEEGYLLISTSNWEGFGLTVAEAMAFGIPVIAFDNYGPREIINSIDNGFLIDKFDYEKFVASIACLIEHEELRNRMSYNSWVRSREFVAEKILENWKMIL